MGSVGQAQEIAREIGVLNSLADKSSEAYIKQQQKIEGLLTGGEASVIIQRAKAERWQKHMFERGRSERYSGQLAAYRASPAVYTAHLYFEMLGQILQGARVYIVPDTGVEVRTNLEDVQTGGSVFRKTLEENK